MIDKGYKVTIDMADEKKADRSALTRVAVKEGNVYCIKCSVFLGMTCDPFRPECCNGCFK